MIQRIYKRIRPLAIRFVGRSGQMDRMLELRQRWNRRRLSSQERRVRKSLAARIQGCEAHRSEVVGAVVGPPGRVRGYVGRVREHHRAVDAMESNRALAIEAIERVGATYQQLPVNSPHRYRLAVLEASRSALLEALSEIDITLYLYVDSGQVGGNRTIRLDRSQLSQIERIAGDAQLWRVFEFLVLPDGTDAFGDLHGCEIEFWTEAGDGLVKSARWNELVTSMESIEFGKASYGRELISIPQFPIDLVYTWVDGDDPAWRRRRDEIAGGEAADRHVEAASDARFASRDELLYSLRSVERYADFVRNVYVVTDQQCPDWLDVEADGLFVVDHSEIFHDSDALPTFNSHSIESRIHHIPGLSEHYIYLNDDFFFGRRVLPDKFFMANGLAKHFLSRSLIPLGVPSLDQKPVDAAAMNGRRLIEDCFRVTPTRKFKHAPYPQLRSVNIELDSLFAEEMKQTARSRFRHPSDIAVASSLHHHLAFVTGRSVPASIEARYVDLGQPNLQSRLDGLLSSRKFDTLCLNDSDLEFADRQRKTQLVAEFLEAYFPVKSRFEL